MTVSSFATELPRDEAQPRSSIRKLVVDSAAEAEATRAFETPTAYLDVGHNQLAYYRLGRGPDLFFVHGWPISAVTFRSILPFLSGKYTCHLIDLPGAGRTVCSDTRAIEAL